MGYRSNYTTAKENNKDSQEYKVKRYYESSAADYIAMWTNKKDLSMHFGYYDEKTSSHRESLLRMNEFLAEFLGINKGDKIVDAGCGYGNNSAWLSEKYDSEVIGLNIVPYQLKMAEAKVKRMGLENKVNFELQNYEKTNFENESFDVYWALESTVHATNKNKVIKDAYRILKKGGKLMICEYMLRSSPELNTEEQDLLQPWLDGWAMPSFWPIEEYKKQLAFEGFENIKVLDITKNVIPSFKRLHRFCAIFIPWAKLNLKLGLLGKDRFNNGLGSFHACKTLWKGIWEYKVITAIKKK